MPLCDDLEFEDDSNFHAHANPRPSTPGPPSTPARFSNRTPDPLQELRLPYNINVAGMSYTETADVPNTFDTTSQTEEEGESHNGACFPHFSGFNLGLTDTFNTIIKAFYGRHRRPRLMPPSLKTNLRSRYWTTLCFARRTCASGPTPRRKTSRASRRPSALNMGYRTRCKKTLSRKLRCDPVSILVYSCLCIIFFSQTVRLSTAPDAQARGRYVGEDASGSY